MEGEGNQKVTQNGKIPKGRDPKDTIPSRKSNWLVSCHKTKECSRHPPECFHCIRIKHCLCEYCTTPRALYTRRQISRVAHGAEPVPACFIFHLSMVIRHLRWSCLMRRHCGLTSRFSTSRPRTGRQSGWLAEQSPLTGYEPNVTVEVTSAKVALVLLPSRGASFSSAYNSGEDVTTTLVSSEVDVRHSMWMLASLLFTQKNGARAAPSRIYHSKFCVKFVTHSIQHKADLWRCTRTRGSRAEIQKVYSPSIMRIGITSDYDQQKQPNK